MNLLTLDKLSFSHPDTPLLQNISLSLSEGEAVGILGCNGAGKTTLFDLICNVRKPSQGNIINVSKCQLYLTQVLTPPPLLKMGEAYELITQLNSTSAPSHHQRYANLSEKKASTCSYGEIRSFITLTLLLMGGDLIILDEPTAGIDPEFRHYIWLGIKNACADGASVLVSSHHTEEIVTNCHRFYMLAHQRIEPFGNGEAFLTRYSAKSYDEAFINAAM